MTVVLTYHDLADERSPLCIPPALFSEQLAVLSSCRANVLTVAELAEAMRGDGLPEDAVVLTFDDGLTGAVREGRRRLDAAAMRATFFCVAGHLGGRSDWPSRAPGAPVRTLAGAEELEALAADGHEIGAHGWTHAPFDGEFDLRREIVDARDALASAVGRDVSSLAYPYGALPTSAARRLIEDTYSAACALTGLRVSRESSSYTIPRVDAHYLRDLRVFRRVVTGSLDSYLGARRIASRTRRVFRKDYVVAAAR